MRPQVQSSSLKAGLGEVLGPIRIEDISLCMNSHTSLVVCVMLSLSEGSTPQPVCCGS